MPTPKEIRRGLYDLGLARRRIYDILQGGTLASIEYAYELAYVHAVLVQAFETQREMYNDAWASPNARFTWNIATEEAGMGEGDRSGHGGSGE